MNTDYEIARGGRHCAVSERQLEPGEEYYAVLYDRGTEFERQDIALDAWQEPPPDAFSFWKARVPERHQNPHQLIDDDVILNFFQRMDGDQDPKKVRFRYVLALFLMRRRVFKFLDTKRSDDHEWLVMRCARLDEQFEVLDPGLEEDEIDEIQAEVEKILNMEIT